MQKNSFLSFRSNSTLRDLSQFRIHGLLHTCIYLCTLPSTTDKFHCMLLRRNCPWSLSCFATAIERSVWLFLSTWEAASRSLPAKALTLICQQTNEEQYLIGVKLWFLNFVTATPAVPHPRMLSKLPVINDVNARLQGKMITANCVIIPFQTHAKHTLSSSSSSNSNTQIRLVSNKSAYSNYTKYCNHY